MPNSNTPRGLTPRKDAGSGVETGGVEHFFVSASDATALYVGDPVVKSGSSDPTGAYASVIRSAAAGPITGVVVGFVPDGRTDTLGYRAASTAGYVLVNTDVNQMYEIQCDAVLVAADIGLNASMTLNAGNAYARRSGVVLDGATKATTATLPLKIRGLSPVPGNDFGAYQRVLVTINNTTEANATAGL